MKVLFTTKPTGFQMFGGLEVQLLRTQEYLVKRGVEATLFNMYEHRIDDFDLIHNFGSDSVEMLPLLLLAKKRRIPIALSTVYWPFEELRVRGSAGFRGRLAGHLSNLVQFGARKANVAALFPPRKICEIADICLPNSEVEADILRRRFGIPHSKLAVVPNAVDMRFASATPEPFLTRIPWRDFVLFVGRIEERKNVLRLITATRRLGYPLVIVGAPVSESSPYYQACLREAHQDVVFLGSLAHEDPVLASAYAAARVLALPSWAETPGLVALEAALSGCPIAITNRGSAPEYFGDDASYCDPGSVNSICQAVAAAWDAGHNPGLAARVARQFNWDVVAKRTEEAYRAVLP